MPRRRASKGRSATSKSEKSSSIGKWDKREDIPLEEPDQFHEQRDKILLEGGETASESDYDDDEVFALKGLDESSEESDENDYAEEEEEEEPQRQKKSKAKERKTTQQKMANVAESPEEVSDEEEEEESWGLKKSAYYSSNAAQIESDDEEAYEMEEQESRRIQAKLRTAMREEDFGYAEALENSVNVNAVDDFWKPVEDSVAVEAGTDKASIIRHLEKTNPETLALAFDWDDIVRSVVKTEGKIAEMGNDKSDPDLGLIHLHHQAQLTYASLLAFFLHLRSSEKYAARPEMLREHPILKRLLSLKQSLTTLEDLNFNMSDSDGDSLDSDDLLDDESDSDEMMDNLDSWLAARSTGSNPRELQSLLSGANKISKQKRRKEAKDRVDQPPKKKRKTSNGTAVSKVTFDVEEPMPHKSDLLSTLTKKETSKKLFGFGEVTSLDDADMADKSGRRKALRFHTAKIESASARRQGARKAFGGDDDVPYRERKKQGEKQKRSSLGVGGADLDDAEPEPYEQLGAKAKTSDGGSSAEDEDGRYYSLVKMQKKERKVEKKAQHDALRPTNRVEFEEDVTTGQRSVTRAILANKGLTLKRSKSVRNPRVKKRQKFEKAKKKLASQKAVYTGGIGDASRYGGETSGISRVVKSVKL